MWGNHDLFTRNSSRDCSTKCCYGCKSNLLWCSLLKQHRNVTLMNVESLRTDACRLPQGRIDQEWPYNRTFMWHQYNNLEISTIFGFNKVPSRNMWWSAKALYVYANASSVTLKQDKLKTLYNNWREKPFGTEWYRVFHHKGLPVRQLELNSFIYFWL